MAVDVVRYGETEFASGEALATNQSIKELAMGYLLGFVLATLAAAWEPVRAGFVEETYADREPYITKSIADAAKALNLSAQDFAFARASAATWFFVGPCRGDARLPPNDAGFAALQVVALADPARPDGAAILEIIAILNREGFDKPSSIACQYAKKLAVHQPSE
jgi:hypothetical protein